MIQSTSMTDRHLALASRFAGCALRGRRRAAFTLIELLIVIAIISILVGLLFPVFATVLENGRQSNTMSNMQQISSALALYKLDNKHYPPVLFSYACDSAATATNGASPGCNVSDTMKNLSADPNATGLFGLYPTYIKDWHVFTSPANTIDDPAATTNPINVNIINGRSLTAAQRSFFKMDAFDASPQVTAINQADQNGTAYVPRYQTSWTDYTPAATSGSGSSYDSRCFPTGACTDTSGNDITDPDYKRQLRWSDPPSNTYVTCTTDHVPNANKVLVMYLDGSVKKINYLSDWATNPPSNTSYTALEAGFYDNISDISPVTAGGTAQMSAALFWRTTATR